MKKFIKAVSYLLAVVIIAVSLNITAFADSIKKSDTINLNSALSKYSPDETVKFIVTLNEDCIIDTLKGDQQAVDYLSTSDGKNAINTVETSQKEVINRIKEAIPDAVFIEELSFAINAVIVETKYSNLRILEGISGVKYVSVSQKLTLSKNEVTTFEQDSIVQSGEMLQSTTAFDEGYTGKGMVVAVIDSALDTYHEAFSTTPPEAAISKADINEVIDSGLLNANATADELYKSGKIPFAYDYFDSDTDTTAPASNHHGTHVSGSAVGNSDTFKGVAPDAQLVFMKVFSDSAETTDEAYLYAALEDCALLEVDVVNLSLGSSAGFTNTQQYEEFFENCSRVGTHIVCAAGNDTDSGANVGASGTGLPLASDPDSGLVGTPSTSKHSISVASAERIREYQKIYFLNDDEKIYYNDANIGTSIEFSKYFDGQTLEYVVIDGVGEAENFVGLDLNGKIAVIKRGEISFSLKEDNAVAAGAVGVIFCNTDDTLINVSATNAVPNIIITNSDEQKLVSKENKTITVSKDYIELAQVENGGQMSSYSSAGVAPDMTLKPEITAPGGGEYSTLPGGEYGSLSGTSMASPQIAGAVVVIKQYYKDYLATIPTEKHNDFINTVLMNTAQIINDQDGVPYTPRKQGSGLAQIDNAIRTDAYVTVKDNHRPVAQLGSSKEGTFSTEITVNNFSDHTKQFDLSSISLVPKLETLQGKDGNNYDCMSSFSRILESDEFIISLSEEKVTVLPGQSATVTISFQLTDEGKKSVEGFENGIYMEGFIVLEDNAQDGVDLHVPYIGFYGDWHTLNIFDETIYSNEEASTFAGCVSALHYNYTESYLGVNPYANEFLADKNKIAVNRAAILNGDLILFNLTMLRSARSIECEVFDQEGNIVEIFKEGEKVTVEYVEKTVFDNATGTLNYFCYGWLPIKQEGNVIDFLDDGTYTIRFTAMPDGTDDKAYAQILEFPLTLDNTAPSINGYEVYEEDGQRYITVNATDNHYLSVGAWVVGNGIYSDLVIIDEELSGAETKVTLNVNELLQYGITEVQLLLEDYAGNQYLTDPLDLTNYYLKPSEIKFVEDSFDCADETTVILEAFVEPQNAVFEIEWECDNDEVATIISTDQTRIDDETGITYYIAEVSVKNVDGVANITAKTQNGKTAVATINAKAVTHFEALDEAINNLQELEELNYTAESWDAFAKVLDSANEVLQNPLAKQNEVDESVVALENAVSALVEAGDPTELEKLVDEAKESISLYTDDAKSEILLQIETAEAAISARVAQSDLTLVFDALKTTLTTGEKLPVEEPEQEDKEENEQIQEDINVDKGEQSPQTDDSSALFCGSLLAVTVLTFTLTNKKKTNN